MHGRKLPFGMAAISLCCGFLLVAAPDKPAPSTDKGTNGDSPAAAGEKKSKRSRAANSADGQMEYNAQDMLKKGIEFIESKQDDRGVKLISSIAQMYPKSKAAVKADLVLGDYYIEKKQFDLALKRFLKASAAEDLDIQAEAFYKLGICYYNLNDFNQAFMALRQVTNKFPGSIYANEACYYIGLCHFRLNRWTQAVEALEKVGTSIPQSESSNGAEAKEVTAEAGQRLFFKVYDEDLVVLYGSGGLKVTIADANGDSEEIELEPLGKDGATYLGSIPTALAEAKPNDKTLQCKGGDEVTVTYTDSHSADGKQNKKILAKVKMVSTATVGFTDGAFQDYNYGIFADQDFFVRVRDLDLDVSPEKDKVKVKVSSLYRVEEKKDPAAGVNLDAVQETFKERDSKELVLTETAPRSGIFTGVGRTAMVSAKGEGESVDIPDPEALLVDKNDTISLEYLDEKHMAGTDPAQRTFKANLLTGEIKDVKIEHRVVDDPEIRARKNLIEAKILLQLGQIFKEVGLLDQASNKAQEGIDRIDDLMKSNVQTSLDRAIIEDAFNTKWELLIVQNKINEAIQVCSTLIRMFPDSSIVDRALMRIADAKVNDGSIRAREEGLNIYRGILQLAKSNLKPEAQFKIAEAREQVAVAETKERQKREPSYKPNYSNIMLDYKKCADNYPDSPFAGQALEKIADYYVEAEDFQRVVELMEQVFRDYPDADFLDRMLLKWAVAAVKLGKLDVAKEKCEKLLSEYPNSSSAKKAEQIKQMIEKKLEAK